jgi:hypothetical protein
VRTFGLDEVVFVYGSRCKQRYFTKRGEDYFPLSAQWDVAKKALVALPRCDGHRLVAVPNPWASCHVGKSNAWAKKELQSWTTTSPWRVGQ